MKSQQYDKIFKIKFFAGTLHICTLPLILNQTNSHEKQLAIPGCFICNPVFDLNAFAQSTSYQWKCPEQR